VLPGIPGTVSNIMIGTVITIGPDPNPGPTQGNTEQITVFNVITSPTAAYPTASATNPFIVTATPLTRNYTAGTPITWRSSAQYQPRNDPVVMHMSVIQ
jgi:hypothetical protein